MRVFPIIKCTDIACNLKCEYCFYRYLDQTVRPESIMSEELTETIIGQLIEVNQGSCNFLWHGGEPLLAGIEFFERVVELQEKFSPKYGTAIKNSIQTNGTLLNKKWASFFKKYGFSVGVSIDGPEHMQNRYRARAGGGDSFKAVMRGIQACQSEGLEVGAIAVVTSYNAQFPEELYRFFVENGLKKFSLNPVFETGRDGKLCEYTVSDQQFGDFQESLLNLWIRQDDAEVEIRQFTQPLIGMIGGNMTSCIFSGRCSIFLDFHPNGDVRPCHSIKGQAEVLGNLKHDQIESIITSDQYRQFTEKTTELHSDCVKCKWLYLCHGGCTDHRNILIDGEVQEKYAYCGSRKRIFSILDQVVRDS